MQGSLKETEGLLGSQVGPEWGEGAEKSIWTPAAKHVPWPCVTCHVTGMGWRRLRPSCLHSSEAHLYWVTAGLAFAEQWNVTVLSSSTGCGSTDKLTSGGSAGRRDSHTDWGRNRAGRHGRLKPGFLPPRHRRDGSPESGSDCFR